MSDNNYISHDVRVRLQ